MSVSQRVASSRKDFLTLYFQDGAALSPRNKTKSFLFIARNKSIPFFVRLPFYSSSCSRKCSFFDITRAESSRAESNSSGP